MAIEVASPVDARGRVAEASAPVLEWTAPEAAAGGAPVVSAPWAPDVDQWCDSLVSLLVGGIGVLSLVLFGALGTFHR